LSGESGKQPIATGGGIVKFNFDVDVPGGEMSAAEARQTVYDLFVVDVRSRAHERLLEVAGKTDDASNAIREHCRLELSIIESVRISGPAPATAER
jgi:hypothetical protein